MCLEFSTFKHLEGGEGIGWKEVRKTDKSDEFTPYYNCFQLTTSITWPGSGGTFAQRGKDSGIFPRVVYKIGRWYKVKHNHTNKTYFTSFIEAINHLSHEYPAGVSLYKKIPRLPTFGNLVYIECRYRKAVAEDKETVVAMEVLPLAVI